MSMTPHPQPAPNAGDLPTRIFKVMSFIFVIFFGTALFAFSSSRLASFMVAISIVYTVMYFGTPYFMFGIEAKHRAVKTLASNDYRSKGIATWTGHLTASEATTQILLIPAAMALAMVLIGFTWVFIR